MKMLLRRHGKIIGLMQNITYDIPKINNQE